MVPPQPLQQSMTLVLPHLSKQMIQPAASSSDEPPFDVNKLRNSTGRGGYLLTDLKDFVTYYNRQHGTKHAISRTKDQLVNMLLSLYNL